MITFTWNNEEYTISKHYHNPVGAECARCGHYPINDVYQITNTKTGEILTIGNVCICHITNKNVPLLLGKEETKQKNIRLLGLILKLLKLWHKKAVWSDRQTSIWFINGYKFSYYNMRRLQKMVTRLNNGYNLVTTQEDLVKEIVSALKEQEERPEVELR